MARDKKNLTGFQLWFEEAWEGWIRPLGLILLLAIFYLLYKFEILGEHSAGVLVVLSVALGSIAMGVLPALALVRAPWQRALLVTMAVAALAATLYPTLRGAIPPPTLAEGALTTDKPSTTLTTGQPGPYEITVSGHFKEAGRSDAEASYTMTATDNGGGSDEIKGAVRRQLVTIRSRKGSSSSVSERNESTYRLPHVRGPQVTLTTDVDASLENGLKIELRHGGLNPIIFIVLGALALLMAMVLDSRLVEPKGKQKSYLTACTAIAFTFSLYYPEEATPHALVRPAVSAFIFALVVGGLSGWAMGGLVRVLFGPKIAKKAAVGGKR